MEIVHTAEFDSPIGRLRVASTERGLAFLELPRASGRGLSGWLGRHAPEAKRRTAFETNRRAIAEILEYLEGKRTVFDLELDVRATPFERSVYRELTRIPYGETRTYAEVARAIGRPKAVRAVGAANAANPVSLVIPCHRVVRTGGKLGGYGGGVELKARLLAMEGARAGDGRLL
jgi:O-6-methylguanine DNA methyltransferase